MSPLMCPRLYFQSGYASIAVLPISLASSTIFSEAMWQRCWATVDKRCYDRDVQLAAVRSLMCSCICTCPSDCMEPSLSAICTRGSRRQLACRQLRIGGAIGFAAITIAVFLLGFAGILAAWSGLFVPSGPDDFGNTILFSLLDTVNGGR